MDADYCKDFATCKEEDGAGKKQEEQRGGHHGQDAVGQVGYKKAAMGEGAATGPPEDMLSASVYVC